MNTLGKILVLAAAGVAAFGTAASAQTGPRGPNIMIAGEDADPGTLPRGEDSFNRVERAIAEQLIARGFKVYDETAITQDLLPQGRVRRKLPELLEIAKLAKTPIDVIVVFELHFWAKPMKYVHDAFQPSVRVTGRMIRVRGGQDLGNYEYGSDIELDPIPGSCVRIPNDRCVEEAVGNQARPIGSAVGNGLATKLAAYLRADGDPGVVVPGGSTSFAGTGASRPICNDMDGTPYVLRVRNFDGPELSRLEEAFTSFACYEHYRVLKQEPGVTDYWYETRADQARLLRNLRFVLEYMGLPGQISLTAGNIIVVEKHVTAPHGVVVVPPGAR